MYAEQHPRKLLSDYVLDMLTVDERRDVERHLIACAHCRAAVQEERHMAQAIRATLRAATRPQAGQLARRVPMVPATAARQWRAAGVRPLLALALCLIFIGSLYYFDSHEPAAGWTLPQATRLAVTVTHTPTATAPATATDPPLDALEPALLPTSAPAPTPVAALLLPVRAVSKDLR